MTGLSAIIREISFEITCEYAYDLLCKQEFRCALTKVPLYIGQTYNEHVKEAKTTASIDRIDSSKGYTNDNIQWVHKKINYMKASHNQEEFVEWCRLVAINNPKI